MNKVEIIKPFEEAFELMKKILFQPFELKKWFVIGFAAFLSGHFGGGFGPPVGNFQQHKPTQLVSPIQMEQLRPWMPLIVIGFFVFTLIFIIIVLWLRARGSFIFTDCIVRNRAAIVQPWREYRKEGNSYFKFQLAVVFASMGIFIVVALLLVFAGVFSGGWEHASGVIITTGFIFLLIFWIALSIFINLVFHFMGPVMYVRRCTGVEAFREVAVLIASHPGAFILFVLFGIALLLGTVIVSGIVCCATCCVATLPYIGTVILLPVYVCLRAFSLIFLRQFGPDYDVWTTLPQSGSPPAQPSPSLL